MSSVQIGGIERPRPARGWPAAAARTAGGLRRWGSEVTSVHRDGQAAKPREP